MKKMIAIATSAAMLASFSSEAGYALASEASKVKVTKTVAQSKVNLLSNASVIPFELYGKDVLNAYNEVFRMNPANIKTITNNGGNYSGSPIAKAMDGDMSTHWETGKPNSSTFTNEVVFVFNESAELNRMVYAARQSGAKGKGFAQEFDIYGSTTDAGDFTLVSSGEYTGSTGDVVEIQFVPTAFKRLKFVYKKANQDWASAAEFSFYKEDSVSAKMKNLFTDDTLSQVSTAFDTAEKLTALENEVQAHPLYAQFKEEIENAKILLENHQVEVTAAKVSKLKGYGTAYENAYSQAYRMPNANVSKVTVNGGSYPGTKPEYMLDDQPTTHWETNKNNDASFTNEVVFELAQAEVLDRVAFLARDNRKGFPEAFEIYASETSKGETFQLVSSGTAISTNDFLEFKFEPTKFKRLKFKFTKANINRPFAAEFRFYTEDKVSEAVNGIFTDGTMSAVVSAYNNVAKINELEEAAKVHPLYPILKDSLELAKKLVNGEVQTEGTIIEAEQRGDMNKHAQQNLRIGFGTNNQPTGLAAMPGETINVYVDAASGDKLPSLIFSQQEGAWNSWARGVQLRAGKNTITVPEIATTSAYAHDVTKGGTVYIVNPYTAEEQGKAPLIRFEGLEKIPFMTKTTDPEQFKTFLITYKQRLDEDKAAHPNVQDRKLIDVVEMASDHVIFTGTATEAYNKFITQGNNPLDTVTGYDTWMKSIFTFYGLDGSSEIHDAKLIRENIRLMQPYGAMYAAGDHTGIQLGTVGTMLGDFNKAYPGWGLNHEIGHRLAMGEREYGEVTNNMVSMFMSVAANSIDNRIPYESDIYKYVLEENKVVMNQQGLFAQLGAYWQLELAHPGYWTELTKLYRERKVTLPNGDNSKQQYLVEFSSEVLGLDLSSYFARHGFTVNPETKAKVAKYPAPQKLWYLNNSVINYEGTGIVDKNLAIKVNITPNTTARTNTLSFSIDKELKQDFLGYEVYRNDVLVGFTGTDQFVDQNVDASINYTYKIVGYDKKLNPLKPVQIKAFKPALSVEDQLTLKLNQTFDPMSYVKAANYLGNDITADVSLKANNVDVTQKGNYEIVYEVKSEGVTETKTTQVTVTSDYAYISDLNAKSVVVGWGELKKDKAISGGIITLVRQGLAATYAKGIGVHANSEVVYDIEGKGYDFFESYIGIDQAMKGKPSSATFAVYVDGEQKFESDVFRAGTEHQFVKIPVTGAREVKLVTTDAKDGNASDHTVWADAKFSNNSSKPIITVPEETTFVKLNSEFDVLSDVTAFDTEDGNLIGAVEVQSNGFTSSKTGTYNVEFSVTDSDGNSAVQARKIVVYSASKYLSDVDWQSAKTDYNVVRKDKASSNNPIKLLVNGEVKEFAKGLGTHASSEIVYNLAGANYEYFETYVGVDRNIPEQSNSSVIFKIFADGAEVYNSGLMKFVTEAKLARIPVKGVSELKLVLDNAGNGNASDHGDFADAKFMILNNTPELTISKSVSTKVGQAIDINESYSAMDSEDGDLTAQVKVTGLEQVNFNRAGKYPITYTVTDSDGNTTTKIRTIAVVDMTDFTYLTDYDWNSTQNSYTAPLKDKSISANTLRLTDENNQVVSYERGIGAHSNSTIVYDLSDKNVDYFTSYVGVDRQMYGSVGSVSFEVFVDGEKKFDSGVMGSRDPQKFIELDINEAKELKLVVTDGGNGNGSDHATWGGAKLHFANGDHLFTRDLEQAIAAAKAISLEGFTPESIAAFTSSLSIAETVLVNSSVTQSEVDEAVAALQQATEGLVQIDLTQVITVADPYLSASIKTTLGVTGELTLGDMYSLTTLTSETRRVRSLEGLQYAKNLETLDITGNEITDFSPLQGLTKLTSLLADPQVVEVGEFKGPVVEVANLVKGLDGSKVIPNSAGVRNTRTSKEIVFDMKEWAANPDVFTIDLSNEEKGTYMLGLTYQVAGNLVQIISFINNN
ncbi:NPCBM/NEW2 domain-containing protein [Paenibacillus odorifer]|uniref:NPCBM/NEW2 domain-containing protein n=1 Tax=Paenibacillus odorifer TaxID=189426 RepID=UPI00068FC480|nr:NPCBM/NEW2 domain-containing protein [Paenibacillus odorifer]